MQLIKKYERIAFDKFKIWISKRDITQLILILGFILGGLFIPVFVLGRRYQYGDNPLEKKQNKKTKPFLWIIIIVVFLLGICFGDITSITSAKKVMFWENTGTNYWNAEYQYFDGFMQRTLWMEEDDVLHVSVETDEGDFDLEIKDADGNIIYSERSLGTKEFEVEVSGKISVRVDGEEHEGSFRFE